MRHPQEADLALYAGGELTLVSRARVAFHVRRCAACQRATDSYQAARRTLKEGADVLPRDLDWDQLAAEMTGNIRVGLAAGACLRDAKFASKGLLWRPALGIAAGMALITGALLLNFPVEQRDNLARAFGRMWSHNSVAPAESRIYLEATRSGIQVTENGGALTMTHPDAAPSVVSVSLQGSVRARYVDSDTGQVTVTNVYAQ
jgi:hypothetical protein